MTGNFSILLFHVCSFAFCFLLVMTIFADAKASLPITNTGSQQVLVTGAAGFIGFHLAKRLAAQRHTLVVAVDNFNDDYDVNLKIERAHELQKLGIMLYFGNACDSKLLENLFTHNNFTHIAHLAVQAEKQKSVKQTVAYVHSNLECMVVLLEVLTRYPKTKLIFASSSSVYGKESPGPFRIEANTEFAENLYTATKKTDELLTIHYCQFYHLKVVGLRFFTVYGPWGRPDMAVYRFAELIMNGREVPIYEANDSQSIGRDFIYIDDVIKCILAAFDYEPSTCGEHFSLGLGSTLSDYSVVKILEQELNITAKIRRRQLPLVTNLNTRADIEHSKTFLSFRPNIHIREGMQRFLTWYKGHRKKREDENKGRLTSERLKWFEQMKMSAMERTDKELQQTLADQNDELQLRISLNKHAIRTQFFSGRNVRQNIEEHVPSDGIICDMDCPRHGKCVFQEGSQKVCQCQTGYYGNGQFCIPRLHKSYPRELEWEYMAQFYSVHNITEMKSGSEMIFFQGMDSPGSDYLVADVYKGNHKKLVEACQMDRLCLAINTNGLMKNKMQPKDNWIKWSTRLSDGLFVYDVNFCLLDSDPCPQGSQCKRLGPADFRCVCDEPYLMVLGECVFSQTPSYPKLPFVAQRTLRGMESENETMKKNGYFIENITMPKNKMHIILSVDRQQYEYVVVVVNSVLRKTSAKIVFHIAVCDLAPGLLKSYLGCYKFPTEPEFDIATFHPDLLDADFRRYLNKGATVKEFAYLSNCANYARFFFHQIFPTVNKAIYLDSDVIANGDVHELWKTVSKQNKILAVAMRKTNSLSSFFHHKVQELYEAHHKSMFDWSTPAFNAGVFYVNLKMWRAHSSQIFHDLKYWMNQNVMHDLWQLGSQSLMWLVFHGKYNFFDEKWNLPGLGYLFTYDRQTIINAKMLHWSGSSKPWLVDSNNPYAYKWNENVPVQCSGRGSCKVIKFQDRELWQCF